MLARSFRVDEARDSNVVSCMRRIGNVHLIVLVWIFNSNVLLILAIKIKACTHKLKFGNVGLICECMLLVLSLLHIKQIIN